MNTANMQGFMDNLRISPVIFTKPVSRKAMEPPMVSLSLHSATKNPNSLIFVGTPGNISKSFY